MNWDDVRVFLALARTGRLADAARATALDPTTVGRRIHRLEQALATALFELGPGGQSLTVAGRRLLAHAEAMEAGARAAQGPEDAGAALGGTLRISVSEGFGTAFVAPRLPRFTAAHPGVEVDLVASTGFLSPSRREADLAVTLAQPRGGPLLVSRLTDYRLGLYATADYLERAGAVDGVAALGRHTLVGYVPDLIYAPELRYLAELDGRLEARVRSSSIQAQARLIAAGAGVGILPCFLADPVPDLSRLLPDAVAITRSFWLVVHRDMRRVARVAAFIAWLRGEVADAQPLLLGRPTPAGALAR